MAIKLTNVCCGRLVLTHSVNFMILTFVIVSHIIFWLVCFAPPRLLLLGATAPSDPVSYANANLFLLLSLSTVVFQSNSVLSCQKLILKFLFIR